MHIKAGDIIAIRHYSGVNPFKSIVLSLNSEILAVKLLKEFAIMNFLEGDPVVFGYETEGEVHVVGCNIAKIKPKEDIIEIEVDRIDSDAEKRQHERFPVSIYGDFRARNSKKKHLAIIKDVSYYGMLIYSKEDLELDDQLEFDIYMDKTMIFLKGLIVRKLIGAHYNEYGIKITYNDVNSLNFVKGYLKRLKETQEESIIRLKNT